MKFNGNNGIAIHCKRKVKLPISFACSERLNIFIICGAKIAHTDAKTSITHIAKPKVNKYAERTLL